MVQYMPGILKVLIVLHALTGLGNTKEVSPGTKTKLLNRCGLRPLKFYFKKIKKASDKDAERTDVSHSSEGLKSKIKVSPYPAIKQSFKVLADGH